MSRRLQVAIASVAACALALWWVRRRTEKRPQRSARAIRHAEKTRKHSTCDFADRVARMVIALYREKVSDAASSGQTVVAAVLKLEGDELSVVSLGVGTKYHRIKDGGGLRDMHAEVFARRGFIQYLRTNPTIAADATWHLYTSSAPCGNACIRRWAKSSQGARWDGPLWPPSNHPTFHPTAKGQGETAFMPKGCDTDALASNDKVSFKDKMRMRKDQGTDTGPWCCSDKIALWNVLGLQGGQRPPQFPTPLFLSSLTCGRKFSEPHMRRAVCCRMAKCPYPVAHPSLLVTNVKLDESVYTDDAGAEFDSPCFWWAQDAGSEWIDGNTGLVRGSDGMQSVLQTKRSQPSAEYRAKREEVLAWVARSL